MASKRTEGIVVDSAIVNHLRQIHGLDVDEEPQRFISMLLSNICNDDTYIIADKALKKVEQLSANNRSLVQLLLATEENVIICNKRLSEKEIECETKAQKLREQEQAFKLEWKTSTESRLTESITKSHDEQDYFFRNRFEEKMEEQKVEYEKHASSLENDRKRLATENRKLQKDKENLETNLNEKIEKLTSETTEAKKKIKELVKMIRRAGIEYDEAKYFDGNDEDDDDEEDTEDWTEPKLDRIPEPLIVVADTDIEVPQADIEVEVRNADDEGIFLDLNLDDYVQQQNEPDEEKLESYVNDEKLEESYEEKLNEEVDEKLEDPYEEKLNETGDEKLEESYEEKLNETGDEKLEESYSENIDGTDDEKLNESGKEVVKGSFLEEDLNISDSDDSGSLQSDSGESEFEDLTDTKEYEAKDLDFDCPVKDPAKIGPHLDRFTGKVRGIQFLLKGLPKSSPQKEVLLKPSTTTTYKTGNPTRFNNESPLLEAFRPLPVLSMSPTTPAPSFLSVPGTIQQKAPSYEKSSIKEKLKKNMNNIVAVNASGNMCEKKRLEMQCLKKQSPSNIESNSKKVPQNEEAANKCLVTMDYTENSSFSNVKVKVADSAISNTKTAKKLIPDLDAGLYQPPSKTRISHVASGSKQIPMISLSGSESSGNDNVPVPTKGAPNTSKVKSKFRIKSIQKNFRKASGPLARLQKSQKSVATKQIPSTMKQSVPAAAGANDQHLQQQQQQQAFAPPMDQNNMFQSMMHNFQSMMQQMMQNMSGTQFNPNPMPMQAGFQGTNPMPYNNPPAGFQGMNQMPYNNPPIPPAGFQGMNQMPYNNPPAGFQQGMNQMPYNSPVAVASGSKVNLIKPSAGGKQLIAKTPKLIKREVVSPISKVSVVSQESLSDSETEDIDDYESPLSPTPNDEEEEVKETVENTADEWKSSDKERSLINQAKTLIKDVLNSTEDDIRGIKSSDLKKNFEMLAFLPDRTLAIALYETTTTVFPDDDDTKSIQLPGVDQRVGKVLGLIEVLEKKGNLQNISSLIFDYVLKKILPHRKQKFSELEQVKRLGGLIGYLTKKPNVTGKCEDVIWKALCARPPDAVELTYAILKVNSDNYNHFDFDDKIHSLRDRVAALCLVQMPEKYSTRSTRQFRLFVDGALKWKVKKITLTELFETVISEISELEHSQTLELATQILTCICTVFGKESHQSFRNILMEQSRKWLAKEVTDGVFASVIRASGEMAQKSIEISTAAELKPLVNYLENTSALHEDSEVLKEAFTQAILKVKTSASIAHTRKPITFPLVVSSNPTLRGKRPRGGRGRGGHGPRRKQSRN